MQEIVLWGDNGVAIHAEDAYIGIRRLRPVEKKKSSYPRIHVESGMSWSKQCSFSEIVKK